MHDAGSYSLDQLDPVERSIASLIVSPDEALRPDTLPLASVPDYR